MERILLPHEVFTPPNAAEYARIMAAKNELDTAAAKREGMMGAYGVNSEAAAYKKQYEAQIAGSATEGKLKNLEVEGKQGQVDTAKTEGKLKQLELAKKQIQAVGESAVGLKSLWAQSKGNVDIFNQAYAAERQKLIGLGVDEKSLPEMIPPQQIPTMLDKAIGTAGDVQKHIDHNYAMELERVKEHNKNKNEAVDKANKIQEYVNKTLKNNGTYRNYVSDRESLQKQIQTALRPEDQQAAQTNLRIVKAKIQKLTDDATAKAQAEFGDGAAKPAVAPAPSPTAKVDFVYGGPGKGLTAPGAR